MSKPSPFLHPKLQIFITPEFNIGAIPVTLSIIETGDGIFVGMQSKGYYPDLGHPLAQDEVKYVHSLAGYLQYGLARRGLICEVKEPVYEQYPYLAVMQVTLNNARPEISDFPVLEKVLGNAHERAYQDLQSGAGLAVPEQSSPRNRFVKRLAEGMPPVGSGISFR